MKKENIAPKIKTKLDTKSEQYQKNKDMMLKKLEFLDGLLDLAEIGGGSLHHDRLATVSYTHLTLPTTLLV